MNLNIVTLPSCTYMIVGLGIQSLIKGVIVCVVVQWLNVRFFFIDNYGAGGDID